MEGVAVKMLAMVAGALFHCSTALAAQSVPVMRLAPEDARLDADVAGIRAIRELPDGRLLITDNHENRLLVADFGTQEVRSIGRVGAGPGEVRHFGRLYALGGDTTLLTDEPDGRRWLLLAGDRIVETLPPDHRLIAISSGAPRGADRSGDVLFTRTVSQKRTPLKIGFRLLDSMLVIRASRGSPRVDTLMKVLGPDQRVQVGGTKDRPFYRMIQATMSSVDAVSMAPDGWVAVATHEPFRVTWWRPDGRMIEGPVIPWPQRGVDARERKAYVERLERRGLNAGHLPDDAWATKVPPFGDSYMALHAPDGRLLLRRIPWSGDEGTNYHVFDRSGTRVGDLRIPEGELLMAFGARSVYRISRDEDGFLGIHRHPWR